MPCTARATAPGWRATARAWQLARGGLRRPVVVMRAALQKPPLQSDDHVDMSVIALESEALA
jgi:hypothetical protein